MLAQREDQKLPGNVFRKEFRYFVFITFDELFMKGFYEYVVNFVTALGETTFWLTAIDPDPEVYYGNHFDFMGAVCFNTQDPQEAYFSALHRFPEESPADALAINSELLLLSSDSRRWAVYASRQYDIAICAFTGEKEKNAFAANYASGLMGDLSVALHYIDMENNREQFERIFRDNYTARQ